MHEQSKLEQILARQRQKLDQVDKRKKNEWKKTKSLSFFSRMQCVQLRILKRHIQMNSNLFIVEFVKQTKPRND